MNETMKEYDWLKKKALRKVDERRKAWNIRSNTFTRHQVAELMVEFLYIYTDPPTEENSINESIENQNA